MTKIAKAVQAKSTGKAAKSAPKAAKTDAPPATTTKEPVGNDGVIEQAKVPDDYVPDDSRAAAPLPPPEYDFRPQPGQRKKEFKVLLVGIKRGLEEIPAECFRHEIPLLKRIHLPENVRILDPEYSAVDVIDSAGAELARLQQKYKQHRDDLAAVFPFPHTITQATGLTDDGDEYGEAPQSVQIVNRRKPSADAAG